MGAGNLVLFLCLALEPGEAFFFLRESNRKDLNSDFAIEFGVFGEINLALSTSPIFSRTL